MVYLLVFLNCGRWVRNFFFFFPYQMAMDLVWSQIVHKINLTYMYDLMKVSSTICFYVFVSLLLWCLVILYNFGFISSASYNLLLLWLYLLQSTLIMTLYLDV